MRSAQLDLSERRSISISMPTPSTTSQPTFKKACTHITMTRIFSKESRCQLCHHGGGFGWVFGCTQDRELLLRNEVKRGVEEKHDRLSDTFERSLAPAKRSPEARSSKLAFLEEVGAQQLEKYTKTELHRILMQRSQVLKTVNQEAVTSVSENGKIPPIGTNSQVKFWLDCNAKECQFKCCMSCRPVLLERSYLSINGIVDGDIPATALTGYGLNFEGERPMALVEHVKNIGLRPHPSPLPRAFSRAKSRHRCNVHIGLGISNKGGESFVHPLSSTHLSPGPSLRQIQESSMIAHDSPSQDPKVLPPFPSTSSAQQFKSMTITQNLECLVPFPVQTDEEIVSVGAPLTPMEEHEFKDGMFGSQPLEVTDGVAVMEESVELRVPDILITQS